MRCNGVPQSMLEDRSSRAQLTIFYGGSINVYDNIPADKAQAIMLLAGESSLSNDTDPEIPNIDTEPLSHQYNATPTRKLKSGVPMARRYSLQCFLKKRRDRIVKKSPYACPSPKYKAEMNQNHSVSLSPFPSCLGFCV